MKRAMQAILIAGEKMKADVLNNRKKITIREGHRDYSNGPVLIGCDILNWATRRNIVSVEYTTLEDVTIQDLNDDGFNDHEDALQTLRQWYPNIEMSSPVTVMRWD